MLQAIRDHLTGWVAVVLFIIIGLAFALWGVPNQSVSSTSPAIVNGEEIPLMEIRRAVRNQLAQLQQFSEISPEYEQLVRDQVLQGLIMDEVMAQHTLESGYHIGDKALETQIRNTEAFQDQGQFSLELLRSRLAPQGLTLKYYEEQVRRALRISQLRRGIIETAFVTDAELQRRARLEREQRRVEWARLAIDNFADDIEIGPEQIQAHYEANTDLYMQPESVDLSYVELNLETLAGDTAISDEELEQYYEREVGVGRFQEPEERRARHILVAVNDETDDTAASEKIEGLLERLQNGEDFAALAAEFSDDPGSGPEGGDLGWAQRSAYVGPFADALFSMTAGELSGPIRTQFGYHIIRMEDQRGGVPKPLEEVADELRAEMRRNLAEREYYDRADLMRDLSFENPSSLEPIAEMLDLEIVSLSGVSRDGGEGIAANPVIIDAAFSFPVLEDRQNSDPIDLTDEDRIVLRVDDYRPAAVRPLEEVRDEIVARLSNEAARDRVASRGQEMLARLQGGESLTELASEFGADYNEEQTYRRTSTLPEILRTAFFKSPKVADSRTTEGVVLDDGSYAVFAVNEVIPGDSQNLAAPQNVAAQQGAGDLTAYLLELRDDASVVLRPELLQQ